ncbi:chemotaxis protein CheW [Duganella aceris]|uniref:Purine-binding chemotaxis protein CheW n=1 Tax=Duganella aceris TaxID=2703883 RepID=A0ABX0FU51_9BURK|nr:chemotaxis protein CheW [Duganella aceris]NGZ88227.1 purine-binding chemotaxis protein CheW [Duganella aceris]
MKLLVFHIGADRYGLRLRDVVRVLPLLELKHVPLAPDSVAGLMDFHGQSVPVIDLCRAAGMPSGEDHFDTRIIVADYHAPEGTDHLLGLRAERVLGVQDVNEAQLSDSGVRAAPFLGQVASDRQGMLQLVELDQLLPESLRALLFQAS